LRQPHRGIGETRSGSSFRGLTHYLLHGSGERKKTPEWVELRNLLAADLDRVWIDMDATASQNARVQEPVFHVVLSPAPGDELTREDWLALADRVPGDLGLGDRSGPHPRRRPRGPTWRPGSRCTAFTWWRGGGGWWRWMGRAT
jgi:hypothetical protein